jgi:hypothetical protein
MAVAAHDDCSAATYRIIQIESDDPAADAARLGGDRRPLGATPERAVGRASGREYAITIESAGAAGNTSQRVVVVVAVPHDARR